MAPWIWPVLAFAAVLVWAAVTRRMFALAAGFTSYGLVASFLASADSAAARFLGPLAVLLIGYWLTAPFYTSRSERLERWLMCGDDAIGADRIPRRLPVAARTLVDLIYLGCYPFMVAAAAPPFLASRAAFDAHWTMVLAAELACYVTLPWLQARPPREVRPVHGGRLRMFSETFMNRLSVRATTIPSGHVAGPTAAALSVWMIAPEWGPWLLAGAMAITAATVAGRYHYAIDAVLGLAVGILPPAIKAIWF